MKNNKKSLFLLPLFCTVILLLGVTSIPQVMEVDAKEELESEKRLYFPDDFLAERIQTLFTDQNGLPVNEVNDICQTADGYLWIASYSGLTRYDGKQFEHYSRDTIPPLPATGVISLYADSKERLWIGSNDKGLIKMEDGLFTGLDSKEVGLSIRKIAEDSKGQIYVATSQGIGYVENGERLISVSTEELLQMSAEDIVIDSMDQLWVLLSSGEIAVVRDGAVIKRFPPDKEQHGTYTSLYMDFDGRIWAGTEDGVVQSFQTMGKEIQTQDDIEIAELSKINSFYRDTDGKLWICSDNQIGYLDEEQQFIPLTNCRITSSMERIIQDYEGTYWVASSRQGVLKMSDSKFFNLGEAAKLPMETVNSIRAAWGDLYIGTDKGLFILNEQGERTDTPLTELLKEARIRQLYLDSQNRLFISTYQSQGLFVVKEDGTYTTFNENNGLASNAVRSVLERSDGTIAVATGKGVDILKDDVVAKHYGVKEGLHNPVILSMYEDTSGTLYLGSDGNGIYTIDAAGEKINQIQESEGLTTGVILRMAPDPKGRGLWISSGNQVDFYDFNTGEYGNVTNIPFFQSNVFDFQFLDDDRMLILYAKGMAVTDISAFQGLNKSKEHLPIKYYERNEGLSATVTANSWSYLSEEGVLYLSLNPGVNVIHLESIIPNSNAPKVAINRIWVDNKEIQGKTVKVPSDTTRITVDFAVPSFVEQDRIKITYQMEGFDEEPIMVSWKDSFSVSYTNLPGGDYVFRISAENGDGVSSERPAFAVVEKARKFGESLLTVISLATITVIVLWVLIAAYLRKKTEKMQEQQQGYRDITEQSLRTIANTIDAKDSNTNGHSIRVARYSKEIARRMELPAQTQEYVYYSALLHDIGKIGIPDAILHKPGGLTEEEMEVMRSHVTIGSEILKDFHSIPDIHVIVESHHEDYDGGGYPQGLENSNIPLAAQIIRVADAYDAMASHRSYRASMTQIYILSELEKYSGTQFNPEIAEIMEDMIRDGFMTDEERWN